MPDRLHLGQLRQLRAEGTFRPGKFILHKFVMQ
jgi:hypothetical protein